MPAKSAGKRHSGHRRHGNTYLQPMLVEIAWAAIGHPGYLKSLYHQHVTRNGGYRSKTAQNKAVITVAHAILLIIWHVLATGTPCDDQRPQTSPDRARRPQTLHPL